jgi:predicted component of type VI protein secretion system
MYASFPFPIQNGEEVVIGSSADSSNIVINDNGQYVSARHCLIKYNGSGNCYTVIDYSTNGTFTANNIRLEKNVPKQFSAGEIIYLGNRDNGFRLG